MTKLAYFTHGAIVQKRVDKKVETPVVIQA